VKLPSENQIVQTNNINYALNFSLTYNLFSGRRINTAIKNAAIREDIGNIEIEKMTLSLRNDLYSNYDNYVFRKRIYGINKRKLESAELNLSITEDKFKLGAINSFDFRTVQINYLTSALQELNSRYSLVESDIALMRITGSILEVYQ
jgi:outer membrane protein TolC